VSYIYLPGYIRNGGRLALWVACLVTCSEVRTGGIYRWTDADGQTHYSDTPRGTLSRLPAKQLPEGTGLRAGERTALRDIERRRQQRHRQAETGRRKIRHQRENRQQACREQRELQRRGRRHVDGKAVSRYLRIHCW